MISCDKVFGFFLFLFKKFINLKKIIFTIFINVYKNVRSIFLS